MQQAAATTGAAVIPSAGDAKQAETVNSLALDAALKEVDTVVDSVWDDLRKDSLSLDAAQKLSFSERERRFGEEAKAGSSWIKSLPLLYGEFNLREFALLLDSKAQPKEGEIFTDLGCGSGKLVLLVALRYPVKLARGIELLEGLQQRAATACTKLLQRSGGVRAQAVKIELGDVMQGGWEDSDVVYCCTTSYTPELMKALSACAEKLKVGARVITTSYGLESRLFQLEYQATATMSWGTSTVFVYRKAHNRRLESVILKALAPPRQPKPLPQQSQDKNAA